jgi:hypothetical protein
MDREENPISAPSIHVGALVGAGSLWPALSQEHLLVTCVARSVVSWHKDVTKMRACLLHSWRAMQPSPE